MSQRVIEAREPQTKTRLGAVLPATEDPQRLIDLARSAERAGADSVWIPDGFSDGHLEALTAMSAVAAATERVEVGVYMLNAALRDPAVLAKKVATLERLAPGRIRIVLGTGWDRRDYEALHRDFPPPDVRSQRTREGLEVLKRETDASVEVAGVKDELLALAASRADGWALSADALDTYFERVTFLRRACADAGRSFEELRLSCTLPSAEGAGDRIADLAEHGMGEFRVAVNGDADQSGLERLVGAMLDQ